MELTPVQSTSLLVAYWRHVETTRRRRIQEPLISDPTATALIEAFLSDEQRQEYESSPIFELGIKCLALRTRFIDDWLQSKHNNGCSSETPYTSRQQQRRQIVNCGAGLCGRPYRLDFLNSQQQQSTTRVFEIDSDISLLSKKKQALHEAGFQEYCDTYHVEADLQDIPSTIQALETIDAFDSSNCNTDWIAEGLLEYMDPTIHHRPLLQMAYDFSGPSSSSRMIMQVLEPPFAELFISKLGSNLPWKRLVPAEEIVDLAKQVGWSTATIHTGQELCTKYNRNKVDLLPGYTIVCLEK